MKTTVVPAQITTVEDRIAGNLTFSQLILIITPVFFSGIIFTFIPPFMTLKGFKLFICLSVAVICLTLAIRIKGRILLLWIGVLGRYNLRPRHYVYNKNDIHLRKTQTETLAPKTKQHTVKQKRYISPIRIPIPQRVWAETVVTDPRAQLEFKTTKKGELRVYIQEIK